MRPWYMRTKIWLIDTCPSVYMACHLGCQKEEATVRTIIQQDAVGNPPAKRTQQRHVQLQERLQYLCRDLTTGQKTLINHINDWSIYKSYNK
jgi:hypothetical protein